MAEKLITLARTDTLNARRRVIADAAGSPAGRRGPGVHRPERSCRSSSTMSPRKFTDRQGGYTRIIKLSDFRIGDGGNLVLLQC